MNNTYENKWVRQIVELQHEDGSWGFFHTLSQPTKKQPITTEQALRRLRILGLTANDEPIRRALNYIEKCLIGESDIPDYKEKNPDWGLFVKIMLSSWIKVFLPEHKAALHIAKRWADVIEKAFESGQYDEDCYNKEYHTALNSKSHKVHYFKSFVNFYPLLLLQNMLKFETESHMLDYVLTYPSGIYYIGNNRPLCDLPPVFTSRETSRFLAAIELLAAYDSAPEKLGFVAKWLLENRDADGMWDMSAAVKDGIYFPLSDSWRKPEDRKRDCTFRIDKLLKALGC